MPSIAASIALAPFENLSGDPAQDVLARVVADFFVGNDHAAPGGQRFAQPSAPSSARKRFEPSRPKPDWPVSMFCRSMAASSGSIACGRAERVRHPSTIFVRTHPR
jgi:hypothetical protein